MKKPRSKEDVVVKLRQHINAADTLRDLVQHPAYSGFFNGHEQALIEKMRNADVADDQARRDAAIELKILGQFRQHLTDVVRRGERASLELDKLQETKDAG